MRQLIFRLRCPFHIINFVQVNLNVMVIPPLDVHKHFHEVPFPAFECVPFETGDFNSAEYAFVVFLCVVFASF